MICQQFSYRFIADSFVLGRKSGGFLPLCLSVAFLMSGYSVRAQNFSLNEAKVSALLSQMTLDEKIGQMVQVDSGALKDSANEIGRAHV